MALEDMPDPSSPQFIGWLQRQDPGIQDQVMRAMGMSQASTNMPSSQGAFAPEISEFAFDLPGMLGGIPLSTNSKGEANPYNVETQQKRLNFEQDLTGSAGLGNNMLAWMTGGQATDPSAWKPIRQGTGSPLQFGGQATVDTYASSGGDDWQTYLAMRIANGDTPAMAMTKLKKMVQGTDETGGVSPASPEFLASLPASADFSEIESTNPPDVKTDRGFATLYDYKALQGFADDLFKGVAKDRAMQQTAWQDPKTKQWYGGYEDKPTEQMQAADKLGLAYPTISYDDPETIDQYSQSLFGLAPGQAQAMDTDRASRIDALKTSAYGAQDQAKAASTNVDDLVRAWNENYSAPSQPTLGAPAQMPGMPDWMRAQPAPASAPADPTTGMRVVSTDAAGNPIMWADKNGALINAQGGGAAADILTPRGTRTGDVPYAAGAPQVSPMAPPQGGAGAMATRPMPKVRVNPDGTVSLATDKNIPQGRMHGTVGVGGDQLVGSIDFSPKVETRGLKPEDIRTAGTTKQKAASAAQDAYGTYGRSLALSPGDLERAKLRVAMNAMARQGRTPLTDQLAARSQTLRNLIG